MSGSAAREWSVEPGLHAGDVLNFDAAQDRLRSEGVDCRTVLVTDAIWSASTDEIDKRRGIAGDLTVFKVAGAATPDPGAVSFALVCTTVAQELGAASGAACAEETR